ncbi:DUF5689 domain-containing protein [Sphingobacterium bambusae]|uniref:DUF5689 domain-containing protein n=1 Tax=Sphingobacterium bambusae TaxID=662858 RepID=A0ABW6BCQ1_9SPHI|nr:DUF5689 domain-containing protein [Sphingobacterium bambusae]WPL48589.1 DUF5689 domain-containing protein [Sphingobacterium bambusae]
MNTLKYLFVALCLVLFNTSCEREYMAPPLNEPRYTGNLDNISILQLKQRYAAITAPVLIEEELIIKGIVVGNDESGNIYKQIYLQDASGAINIGIDQNAMYASYHVGQELYVHLKDLYVVKYGGELQIGMGSTNANRIAWQVFQEKAFPHSWPNVENAQPKVVTLNALTEDMVHTLVEIQDVRFTNGGKNAFTTGDATTNEQIRNDAGNVLDVRSSNFSDFAKDILPVGKGTVVGILSRFNGGWQLFLRTKADVKDFDGQAVEPEAPQAGTFFNETFGTGTYPSGNRPKINAFTEFDMKAPIQYSDESGWADIRSVSGDNGAHIWLPATRDAIVKISGINTLNKGAVTLSFQLAANLFNAGETANTTDIQVRANGTLLSFTGQALSNAAGDNSKFYTISIPNIPQSENLSLEFVSGVNNKLGFRLDNIKLVGGDANSGGGSSGPIIVNP